MMRIFLGLCAVMFAVWGGMAFHDVIGTMESLGVTLSGPHALIEGKAVYGGLSLALVLLCILGIFKRHYASAALGALSVYFGGLAIGRIISILSGDPMERTMPYFLGFELVFAVIATILLISYANAQK